MIETCKKCGKTFERKDLEEHHLIPKSIFDERHKHLSDRMRLLLCERCHDKVTRAYMDNDIIWMPGESKNLKVID